MHKIKISKNIQDQAANIYKTKGSLIKVIVRLVINSILTLRNRKNTSFSIQAQEHRLNAAQLLAEETSLPPPIKTVTVFALLVLKQWENSKKKLGSLLVFGLEERLTTTHPYSYSSGLTAEKYGKQGLVQPGIERPRDDCKSPQHNSWVTPVQNQNN